MDAVLPLLDILNEQDLQKLQHILKKKIRKQKKEALIRKINSEINTNGYSWTVQKVDTKRICTEKISYIEFPLYTYVETYDEEDKNDCHVVDVECEQNDWVKYLNCDYIPTDKDDLIVSYNNEDWDTFGTFGDPISGKAKMMVLVFYKKCDKLNESNFKIFDNEGNIKECKMINNELGDDIFVVPKLKILK
jgi:hypothetical protein